MWPYEVLGKNSPFLITSGVPTLQRIRPISWQEGVRLWCSFLEVVTNVPWKSSELFIVTLSAIIPDTLCHGTAWVLSVPETPGEAIKQHCTAFQQVNWDNWSDTSHLGARWEGEEFLLCCGFFEGRRLTFPWSPSKEQTMYSTHPHFAWLCWPKLRFLSIAHSTSDTTAFSH